MRFLIFFLLITTHLWTTNLKAQNFDLFLFSPYGEELNVEFKALFLTEFNSIDEMNKVIGRDPSYYISRNIEPTIKFLFGPLTHREWGGIRYNLNIEIDLTNAEVSERGVLLPYTYKGIWLLDIGFLDQHEKSFLPVPYNTNVVYSDEWKKCTDGNHLNTSSFWYYWEPERIGCDHTEGTEYQNIHISVSNPSIETKKTYPEYKNMIQSIDNVLSFNMTFAFGYVEDVEHPNPEKDYDMGVYEYRKFLVELKKVIPHDYTEMEIWRRDYPYFTGENHLVGRKFSFVKKGVQFNIKVVTNAGVDQMILFARSYAQEHDSYFAWMGHSRVGSGFDASRFKSMLIREPNIYSLVKKYQLVYWGGCNSYSYYTEPFFKLKASLSNDDPNGTRYLDIIANALPSYFSLNSTNALIQLNALLNWETPTSYQDILIATEKKAERFGTRVLAVVIGDEDNDTE